MYDLLVLSVWSRVIFDFFAHFRISRRPGDGGDVRRDAAHRDLPGRDGGRRPSM